MNRSDQLWHEDKERYGWCMPRAAWWRRLPVIRHVRSVIEYQRAFAFYETARALGIGIGGIPHGDLWVIYGIRRGWERPL